jgi:hypothetical protein
VRPVPAHASMSSQEAWNEDCRPLMLSKCFHRAAPMVVRTVVLVLSQICLDFMNSFRPFDTRNKFQYILEKFIIAGLKFIIQITTLITAV